MTLEVVLATANHKKGVEFQAAVTTDIRFHMLSELKLNTEWNESGHSFADNALIKARFIKKQTAMAVLADDSGLIVPALAGEPGIYSGRYAGDNATDEDNINKLLSKIAPLADSQLRAFFVACLAYIDADGRESLFYGMMAGTLIRNRLGDYGFGYDPLFYLPQYQRTLAQLSMVEKNSISHRGRAITKWQATLLK